METELRGLRIARAQKIAPGPSPLDIDQNNFAKRESTQPAVITIDAYPDHKYKGQIVEVSPEADRQKATVQIKVKTENSDQYLRPDMNTSVSFHEEPKAPSETTPPATQIVIPQSAVRDNSVFVMLNGPAKPKQVVLNGSGAGGVKASSGLAGGEDIIVNPPGDWKDKDKVRVR
jgi:HlyD family secretion protein